ncbi:uncharacterized protein BDR25DRAFT_306519 [Lindgomyces ingoldianus]|uniref:Uncharacterized protein n=1 Tax=Lindgomyces ingoldianus TaxID=673940 RepID=A0ACB6QHX8_9PLEO|nr:uncharacterized protein BDR25DRAFT_306519 [Lindgomyces ingoldianus]KAF2465741.1 hypothetical protein BDR25DRAFT_306519 [Lindgomyces ingoldianus]
MHYTLLTLALAASAYAKTDLSGCTSSKVITNGGASLLYYVPGTGEICAFLDCGGGRAPPKTTVPGCPQYSGTASYEPSFISIAAETSSAGGVSVKSTIVETASGAKETGASSAEASASGSSFATITTAPKITGTGGLSPTSAPGNNLTATVTRPSSQSANPSAPAGTGAANLLAVAGKGVFGMAVGVVGFALL